MESMGGVGYLENNDDIVMNVARLYRDANVGPIWEGTTSVMAEDLVRVLKGKTGPDAMKTLARWIAALITSKSIEFARGCCSVVHRAWADFEHLVVSKEVPELHWMGREVLNQLEAILCACLLLVDAAFDQDAVAVAVAKRWIDARFDQQFDQDQDWTTRSEMDWKIYLGISSGSTPKL